MSTPAGAKTSDILTKESSTHERALFQCRMAENAERFDDMVEFIKDACHATKDPLGPNERNYLSVAYKNSVGTRRAALRCLSVMKSKYEGKHADTNVEIVDQYYKKVLDELERICREVISLIEKTIMRPEVMENLKEDQGSWEFKVFFLKMMADYYRYLSEFNTDEARNEVIEQAAKFYKEAKSVAESPCPDSSDPKAAEGKLPPAHPIRLGLCLNYSVFMYEIQNKHTEAKNLARKAFDDALVKMSQQPGGDPGPEYKDSTLILQLLRDNTTLWSSGAEEEATKGAENTKQEPGAEQAAQ